MNSSRRWISLGLLAAVGLGIAFFMGPIGSRSSSETVASSLSTQPAPQAPTATPLEREPRATGFSLRCVDERGDPLPSFEFRVASASELVGRFRTDSDGRAAVDAPALSAGLALVLTEVVENRLEERTCVFAAPEAGDTRTVVIPDHGVIMGRLRIQNGPGWGRPLEGQVELSFQDDRGQRWTKTVDSVEGTFRFPHVVSPFERFVAREAAGWLAPTLQYRLALRGRGDGWRASLRGILIEPDATREIDLDCVVERRASGRVVFMDGAPASNATVSVRRRGWSRFREDGQGLADERAETTASGEFSVSFFTAEAPVLSIELPGGYTQFHRCDEERVDANGNLEDIVVRVHDGLSVFLQPEGYEESELRWANHFDFRGRTSARSAVAPNCMIVAATRTDGSAIANQSALRQPDGRYSLQLTTPPSEVASLVIHLAGIRPHTIEGPFRSGDTVRFQPDFERYDLLRLDVQLEGPVGRKFATLIAATTVYPESSSIDDLARCPFGSALVVTNETEFTDTVEIPVGSSGPFWVLVEQNVMGHYQSIKKSAVFGPFRPGSRAWPVRVPNVEGEVDATPTYRGRGSLRVTVGGSRRCESVNVVTAERAATQPLVDGRAEFEELWAGPVTIEVCGGGRPFRETIALEPGEHREHPIEPPKDDDRDLEFVTTEANGVPTDWGGVRSLSTGDRAWVNCGRPTADGRVRVPKNTEKLIVHALVEGRWVRMGLELPSETRRVQLPEVSSLVVVDRTWNGGRTLWTLEVEDPAYGHHGVYVPVATDPTPSGMEVHFLVPFGTYVLRVVGERQTETRILVEQREQRLSEW